MKKTCGSCQWMVDDGDIGFICIGYGPPVTKFETYRGPLDEEEAPHVTGTYARSVDQDTPACPAFSAQQSE